MWNLLWVGHSFTAIIDSEPDQTGWRENIIYTYNWNSSGRCFRQYEYSPYGNYSVKPANISEGLKLRQQQVTPL